MPDNERARTPEDLTRLFVERSNEGDAAGVAALYEEQAVRAYPPGGQTVGRAAIRALWAKVLANAPRFEQEAPLPTLISGDIALTSTPPRDGAGTRAVSRRGGGERDVAADQRRQRCLLLEARRVRQHLGPQRADGSAAHRLATRRVGPDC